MTGKTPVAGVAAGDDEAWMIYGAAVELGSVWEGFGSSKNSSGSSFSDGAAFLVELEPF